MQTLNRILAVALVAGLAVACKQKEGGEHEQSSADTSDLQTDAEKFGYAVGTDIGRSLKPVKDSVDLQSLMKGMQEAMEGQNPRLNDQEREQIKTAVSRKLQQKNMEERVAKAKENGDKGKAFLEANGKRPGVSTTKSGLQYESITEGKGASPRASDKVTVHYRGTLIDGTEFDSSYKRNQPVTFPLGNVIPGWTEGLQLMKEGGKAKLYIPSELGYGERGAGAKIGPNETLIFEVELLNVEKTPAAKPAEPAKPEAKKSDKK
jgi:FKBP-type peptidyl-prolyl cis-trans isomerase FkpA